MKRLIIHPEDRSTDFLKPLYVDRADATVVTHGRTKRDRLREMMAEADQVIMMGHGSGFGLFCGPTGYGHMVDRTFVDVLREKDNSIFIWCNADKFVRFHKLKGFYSGMFISEMSEARYCKLPWWTNEEHVQESNAGFTEAMRSIDLIEPAQSCEAVKTLYGQMAQHNPVAGYNHERLYAS